MNATALTHDDRRPTVVVENVRLDPNPQRDEVLAEIRKREGRTRVAGTALSVVTTASPHDDGLDGAFCAFVRGEAASLELFEGLRVEVRAALRRRRCWMLPPSYLGYGEYQSWAERGATEDLTSDVLLGAFVPRSLRLAARIRAKVPPRALIRQVINQHLTNLHRGVDPIGYRVYVNVMAAFEAPGWRVERPTNTSHREVVDALVQSDGWDDHGLALGQQSRRGTNWLRDRLIAMEVRWSSDGAESLIRLLKAPVRDGLIKAPTRERKIATELGGDGEERFVLSVDAVEPSLLPSVTRAIHESLGAEMITPERRDTAIRVIDTVVGLADGRDCIPTQAEVAADLGLSRATMCDYFALLRRVVARLIAEGRL